MKKPYKMKLKRGKFFNFIKSLAKRFKKKPEIINLSGEELKDKAIYLSNHSGAHGPITYELYFPKRLTPWGTHEMCENYRTRWNYLYHVFYRQKLHWGKFKSFVVASLFAPISLNVYRGAGLIGTYTDARFVGTLKTSCRVLDQNSAIIIYPEDSTQGYMDPPPSFHRGYMTLARMYKRLRGEDLPVYVCYCNAEKQKIVVSKPMYIDQLLQEGKTEEEINQMALATCQKMYHDYIEVAEATKEQAKNKKISAT